MSFKKRITSLAVCGALIFSNINFVFADSARVVTIGANLTKEQKATMLKYFGVNEKEVVVLEVNNQEERKYLEGIASESQLGNKTYSCAYVEPTKSGSGINVKTANLTWLTSSMVASTLSTAGMTDADVVVACVFPVSGTGALTGIMKAFEDATGEALDEDKKELASEELIITGDLGEDIGADKATGIVNDIKTEIIKNNTSDTTQIAETINNVVNNYNVTINAGQQEQLEQLMKKISEQDYDYKEMKNTLKGISKTVEDKLESIGESIDRGFFENITNTIKGWFTGFGEWFSGIFTNKDEELGILGETNDALLGENAIIDATDENAINLPSSEEVQGFFAKIWNWFTGLFKSDKVENESIENNSNNADDSIIESIEQNSTIEENVQVDESSNTDVENNTVDNTEDTSTIENSTNNNSTQDTNDESTQDTNDESTNVESNNVESTINE